MEPARHRVLVNPSAGAGRAGGLAPAIRAAMDRHQLEHELVLTRSADHAREQALTGASKGETVVVASGDGLVGQVGGALAESGTPLGVIPGGRGNDFARVLGIPVEVEPAVALLAASTRRSIDVGEVNGTRFLCIASCGFDSDANRIANETRVIRGNLVYLYAALRALAAWKPARFEVTVDGERRGFSGYSVAAANSKAYGGGMFVAPDALVDDGALDVVCTAHVGKLRFLANLPQVFKGTHVSNDEVSVLRGSEVRIEADRSFAIYADGDHVTDLPATLRVLPRALEVIAPPAA